MNDRTSENREAEKAKHVDSYVSQIMDDLTGNWLAGLNYTQKFNEAELADMTLAALEHVREAIGEVIAEAASDRDLAEDQQREATNMELTAAVARNDEDEVAEWAENLGHENDDVAKSYDAIIPMAELELARRALLAGASAEAKYDWEIKCQHPEMNDATLYLTGDWGKALDVLSSENVDWQ